MHPVRARAGAKTDEDPLESLLGELREAMASGSSGDVWACEPALRRFHDSGAFRSWVNRRVRSFIEAPDEEAPTLTPLHIEEQFTLSAAVLTRTPFGSSMNPDPNLSDLKDHPQAGLVYVAGPAALHFELFEQPDVRDHEVFDKSKALRNCGTRTIAPGCVLRLIPGRTVLSDVRTSGVTVLLTLYGRPECAITWGYDPNTLLPVRPYSSTLHSSRLEYALALLGEIGHFDAAASLESAKSLLDHPVYFVRWRALHALNELSAPDAIEALERLCDDPHPHVRSAARRTKHMSAALQERHGV